MHPPTIDSHQRLAGCDSDDVRQPMQAIGDHRFGVIWIGAFATISFAGLTGLLLQSRWSYASLGATFVALLTVVLAVTTSPTVNR